jgi:3-hydroxyacyl-CoA dehydrogenase
MSATYQVTDGIAVITMNYPPVNGLGFANRVGIADGLGKAAADPDVKAIVLTGAGRGFCAGGDVSGADEANAALMKSQLSHAQRP